MEDLYVEEHRNFNKLYTICNRKIYYGIYDIVHNLYVNEEDIRRQLKSYDYVLDDADVVLFFKNKNDAEKFLKWLIPFIIAAKLSFENKEDF